MLAVKSSTLCTVVILLGALLVPSLPNAAIYVQAGKLIDPERRRTLKKQTIIIEGDRVVAVTAGYQTGDEQDEVIKLHKATVMPGLIDMHVHITSEQSPKRFADRFKLGPADVALEATGYARRTVMAGFTTVRDLGTQGGVSQALRRAIRKGTVVGPRIFTAGKSLATTGGHADPSNGLRASLRGDPGPAEGVINSPADARKAVRARYREGADLIKITATGGVLSEARSGENPQFTIAEVAAIVETARDYGYKVAAHAHGAEGMKRAILGGVDSIEHGTYMSDEVMKLMKERGTWYVPTIFAGRFVAEKADTPGYFSELVRPKAVAIGPQIQETFARAYKAGVPIAFGTDSGVSRHGDNWQEFVYMVEAGMPPMETIRAATVSAATLLGEQDQLGMLKKGMYADIIATSGNPIRNIEAMGDVFFVMQGGIVLRDDEPFEP
ncbi:MAG: amidohydrolase family protein [Pseudomonadales bacterium]